VLGIDGTKFLRLGSVVDGQGNAITNVSDLTTTASGLLSTQLTAKAVASDVTTALASKADASKATNYTITTPSFGPNTNFTWITTNTGGGPGITYEFRTTNGAIVQPYTVARNNTNGQWSFNGNVGIRTATPSNALEVAGSARFSGGITNVGGVSFAGGNMTVDTTGGITANGTIILPGTVSLRFSGVGDIGPSEIASSFTLSGTGFTPTRYVDWGVRTSNTTAHVFSNTPSVTHFRDGTKSNAAPITVGSSMGRTNWPLRVISGAFPDERTVAGIDTNGVLNIPTNAAPTAVTIGVTAPDHWFIIKNLSGNQYFVPAWTNH
jgi:hypothetical protein